MTLFQFLRYVHDNVPIILFDLNDNMLKLAKDKEEIDLDFMEYTILDITIGNFDAKGTRKSLYITLIK